MNGMKMFLNCSVALMMVLGLSTLALARGTSNVSNTVHNMSVSAPGFSLYASDETQVCIFCHTPHGGSNTGPLWNRPVPAAGAFVFYDSSTISAEVKNVAAISNESLLCLSCHDGSVSVYHLLNYGESATITNAFFPTTNLDTFIVGSAGASPRIGASPTAVNATGQLGDDHPISFSYNTVLTQYTAASRAGLHTIAEVNTLSGGDVRFFGATNRVECSTCHDPHVDYETETAYAPFLNMSNAGSALCLACHDK